MRVLLASSSRVHGSEPLQHLRPWIQRLFESAESCLFVPWALADLDGYADGVAKAFSSFGLRLESIHRAGDPAAAVRLARGLFIGGGNTFRLLDRLHRSGLMPLIRQRVRQGLPYMGTSAGSNVACPSIRTTNDMPIVEPPGLEALGLVPFQINPHYLDPDPDSTHMGETRETRLREFHEENRTPVVALREGSLLWVEDLSCRLEGSAGGKLFLRGREPQVLSPGADLSPLLREG